MKVQHYFVVLLLVLIHTGCSKSNCDASEVWNPFDLNYDIEVSCLEQNGLQLSYSEHVHLIGSSNGVTVRFWITHPEVKNISEINDIEILSIDYFISLDDFSEEAVKNKLSEFDTFLLSDIDFVNTDQPFFVQHRINNIITRCNLNDQRKGIDVTIARPIIDQKHKKLKRENLEKYENLLNLDEIEL